MPSRRLIPDVIDNQDLPTVPPSLPVIDAVKTMVACGMSAAVITTDGSPYGTVLGIFTEHDLATRGVALDRDLARVRIREVMTPDPDWLGPDARAGQALRLMTRRNCRHLLVMDNARLIGVVSIQDLYVAINQQLEESVHEVEAFVYGHGYSVNPAPHGETSLLERLSE